MPASPDPEQSKSRFFAIQGGTVVIADLAGGQNEIKRVPQTVIDKKYQILGMLGEGGMGAVFKAHHMMLNKDVALKTFRSADLTDEARLRFQREAQAIAKLSHKNIIQVYDFGLCEDGVPYYTMEYLLGQSLSDRIKKKGPLSVEQAIKLFIEVCQGLALAHGKGVIHRDLKPANIFIETNLSPQGKSESAKIVDFGIASLTGQDEAGQKLTGKGIVFGSPLYMSPEQALGQSINECADIYSLGCSLFEALTGHPPFEGANALETIILHQTEAIPTLSQGAGGKTFPPSLERTLATMLAKSPRQRQQTMEQVASELAAVDPKEIGPGNHMAKATGNKFDSRAETKKTTEELSTTNDYAVKKRATTVFFAGAAALIVLFGGAAIYFSMQPGKKDVSGKNISTTRGSKSGATAGSTGALMGGDDNTSADSVQSSLETPLPPEVKRQDSNTPTPGLSCRVVDGPENKKYFEFKAPQGINMGYFLSRRGAFAGGRIAAEGIVHWPQEIPVEFNANNDFLSNPANLDIFPPGSVHLIDMSICLNDYKDRFLVKHLAKMYWLSGLNFGESELSDNDIKALNACDRLTGFDIKRSPVTGAGLAQAKWLPKLVYLQFCDCSNATALLKALKKGNSLTALYFYSRTLSHEDVKIIAGFKSLKCLQLNRNQPDDEDLAAIATLPHLEELFMEYSVARKKQSVDSVRKLRDKGLKYIKLNGAGMSAADRKAIKDMFPPKCAVFACEEAYAPEAVEQKEWKDVADKINH